MNESGKSLAKFSSPIHQIKQLEMLKELTHLSLKTFKGEVEHQKRNHAVVNRNVTVSQENNLPTNKYTYIKMSTLTDTHMLGLFAKVDLVCFDEEKQELINKNGLASVNINSGRNAKRISYFLWRLLYS